MKTCAYCHSPMDAAGLPKNVWSHGLCAKCDKALDVAVRMGEPEIKKCPDCPRNIGAWLKACHPCLKESALV